MDELSNKDIKLGEEYQFEYGDRYFLQNAERVMKDDIVRGLVELITNADDSYGRMQSKGIWGNGGIAISVERRRKGKNTTIELRDMAEGMNIEEMVKKLRRVGDITSQFIETKGGVRGFGGRGSRECIVFGPLIFKSIKNNVYSEVHLKKPASFIPITERGVTELDRVRLDIPKGNGTRVILEVDSRFSIPNHQFLVEQLPKYYSLRDIASSSKRKLELINLGGQRERKDSLVYTPREGNVEVDETFTVDGYPDAEVHLVIKKSAERIKMDSNSPYWEGGILIQSSYALHGVTGFSRDVENNPYFEHYFGRITCPYIDKLAVEYEIREKQKIAHTLENPSRIIDPLRTEGLTNNHPFTKALYMEAVRRFKLLLKRDEEAATNQVREIENKKTTDRLRKLSNEVSRFIKDRTENLDNIDDEYYLSNSDIQAGGMVVIPGGAKIPLGEERKFYVYVKPISQQDSSQITLSTDSTAIQLSSDIEGLLERDEGILYSSFSVLGIEYKDNVKIKIAWGGIEKQISVSVVKKEEIHPYVKDFSFEKSEYKVREGKQKEIQILAAWPNFVHGEVECLVVSNNDEFVDIIGKKTKLKYTIFDDGTEMAIGKMKVFGKKIGGPTIIKTTLQHKEITTKVIVLTPKELGHNIEIKLVDEDLGEQRAVWSGDILKINTRHKNIRRYSGPPPSYSGQDSIHFHLLLAELIADKVAQRILELNEQKNIHEYEDMKISGFYQKHRKHMNDFLEIAHKIQIPENEIAVVKI